MAGDYSINRNTIIPGVDRHLFGSSCLPGSYIFQFGHLSLPLGRVTEMPDYRLQCVLRRHLLDALSSTRLRTPIVSKTKTKQRSLAAANRELCLLSKIFSRAVVDKQASHNPCSDVDLLQG